uniref:CCHC-type domain-containing protein n=1 Tax=Tanacetum cinerariifolium TaxID=118510 RepID=A0A6L2KVU2_TANCI|nr:hypothetical protein [Tanacetum cinerariifolium]
MELCTGLQRQQTQMAAKFKAQDLEISGLKARVKFLEDKDKGSAEPSQEDAPIKVESMEIGEEVGVERSTELGSNNTKEMVNVLSSMEAVNILTSGVATISVSPVAGVSTVGVPTVSGLFHTVSAIFTTASMRRFTSAMDLGEGNPKYQTCYKRQREGVIVSSVENRPHMLDKSMYNSWESRMLLYIKGKKNGRMMLEEDGQIRKKKYDELTEQKQLQDDCDVHVTNIVLQGLPPDMYARVNHCQSGKDIWERVKLFMKGTELSYQERKCKLYNEFDKFTSVKDETLHEYYLCFAQLINDMQTIVMKMQQVQVNTKFLNALQLEWSKFVNYSKLAKNMYTTNYDQLTSSNPRNQATIQDGRVIFQQVQGRQSQSFAGTRIKGNATSYEGNNAAGLPRVVKCYNCQEVRHIIRQCTKPKRPRNSVWFKEKILLVQAQESGQTDDLDAYDSDCDDISSIKAV